MKRPIFVVGLILVVGCLFLSVHSVSPERPKMYVKCWETWNDSVVYSGWTNGHGVGMAVNKTTQIPFIGFKDQNGEQVIIVLTGRICAVAATNE